MNYAGEGANANTISGEPINTEIAGSGVCVAEKVTPLSAVVKLAALQVVPALLKTLWSPDEVLKVNPELDSCCAESSGRLLLEPKLSGGNNVIESGFHVPDMVRIR